jgi:exopolyphosphatase/guanosine-5'-triphosphate,3'-diphosphate pyrophosphatase
MVENRQQAESDRRLALIDIGSNSVRLVVFDGRRRAPESLFNEKVLCGLGRHIETTGRLDPEGIELALPNLRRFSRLAREMGIHRMALLATAAVRDAEDGPQFIGAVEDLTGEKVRVLSGREEAALAGAGVIAGIPDADGLMGDLGGGSLELVEISGGRSGRGITLPLGTFRLMEQSKGDPRVAIRKARGILEGVGWLPELKGKTFYPVGGTWRNMSRVFMALRGYPLTVIHGFELFAAGLIEHCGQLADRHEKSLKHLHLMSSTRLQAMPYGAVLMSEILHLTGVGNAVFSAYGLREGYIFSQLTEEELAADPLVMAAREMGRREARFGDLGEALFLWTENLFAGESANERRLRHAACWLSDIAWRENADYRAQQAFSRIIQSPFIAIDHPGRLFLAFCLYRRYEGDPLAMDHRELLGLMSPEERHRADVLGTALRLAYRVSGATPGLLGRTRLIRKGVNVDIELPQDGSIPDGRAVRKTLKSLNDLRRNG